MSSAPSSSLSLSLLPLSSLSSSLPSSSLSASSPPLPSFSLPQ
jgi:hypothetical protein